ncbi:hypothetical protein BDV26DRAFT_289532 [Aspergillus bertholletiae]|uniref:Uncharacterized protein n=1 Tax=Aspergillus bertholletiae TaxID=1226010 RepID=A0A5N7BHK0_9EURO|nr:hypothetical protein BDV26DRAFT_289532 [Aspergillus bertholletiae]
MAAIEEENYVVRNAPVVSSGSSRESSAAAVVHVQKTKMSENDRSVHHRQVGPEKPGPREPRDCHRYIVYASSSTQLKRWRVKLGIPAGPVVPLPINQVVPGIQIDSPAPGLDKEARGLHKDKLAKTLL